MQQTKGLPETHKEYKFNYEDQLFSNRVLWMSKPILWDPIDKANKTNRPRSGRKDSSSISSNYLTCKKICNLAMTKMIL